MNKKYISFFFVIIGLSQMSWVHSPKKTIKGSHPSKVYHDGGKFSSSVSSLGSEGHDNAFQPSTSGSISIGGRNISIPKIPSISISKIKIS